MDTKPSIVSKEVIMADSPPTVLIGERINRTGKRRSLPAWQPGRKSD
ncbi:MAG: hypothetical protein ACLFVD_01920 [Dehalococcoidia bacterium]